MGFCEQAAQGGFDFRGTIEGRHKCSPLLLVQYETGLIGQCLFRFLAGATHDEIADVNALALSGNFDESFFRRRSAELEAPVARLVWRGYCHIGPYSLLYC